MMFQTAKFMTVVAIASVLFVLANGMNTCKEGTFLKGNKCILCPPGTYQNETGAIRCKPCPQGYFNKFKGAQGRDLCEACPAGTFSGQKGATSIETCKPCAKGKNSVPGSTGCLSCPPGDIISKCDDGFRYEPPVGFVGRCADCFRGCSFKPEKLKCRPCRFDSFSAKKNSLECTECPYEQLSLPGSSKCTNCPPGTGNRGFDRDDNFKICFPCDNYVFNDGSTGFCRGCPPGFIGEKKSKATKCVPCPAGTKREAGDTKCMRCKRGENTSIKGASFCMPDDTPCAANFFRNKFGACQRCSIFQRLDLAKKECVPCKKNHVSEGGLSTTCRKCPPGSHASSIGLRGCNCNGGHIFSSSFQCTPCPPGAYRPDSANEFTPYCSPCDPGSYSPKSGMSKCLKCPIGKVQPLVGQKKCVSCPKGLRPELPTVARCVDPKSNCAPGEVRSVEGGYVRCAQSLSEPCPPGSVKSISGSGKFKSAFCSRCGTSERYDPVSNTCKWCGGRSFSKGGLDTVCKKCPSGESYSDVGCTCEAGGYVKGKCVKCKPGLIPLGVLGCQPCPPGTFRNDKDSFECEICPAGTFSEGSAGKCTPCPAGTTSFGVGESNCVKLGALAS